MEGIGSQLSGALWDGTRTSRWYTREGRELGLEEGQKGRVEVTWAESDFTGLNSVAICKKSAEFRP